MPASPRKYRFGQFVLDLAPQPLRVLQCLVERAGVLVTRDDIRRQVWDKRYVEFDPALNFCIRRIRSVLNDPVRHPVYIQTIRGRGYRFIAPVAVDRISDHAGSTGAAATRDASPRPHRRDGARLSWRAAAVVATFVVPLFLAFLLANGTRRVRERAPLILVLDFAIDDPRVRPRFGRELGDAVAARLAQTTSLRVLRRSADPGRAAEVRRRLRADFVLAGGATPSPAGTAIVVRLIRVRDAREIWAERYAVSDSTAASLRETVAARVSGTAGALLADAVAAGAASVDDLEALDRFLRANEYIERLGYRDLVSAQQLYAEAGALDTTFAAAPARESWVLSWLAWLYGDTAAVARAESLARRATVLAPRSLDAGIARALLRYGRRQYAPALAILDSVLRRAPDHGLAIGIRGWVLRRQGRWDEALEHLHRAFALDPTYDAAVTLAEAYSFLRSYAASSRYWERAIAIDPSQPIAYMGKAAVLLLSRGDTASAATVIREGEARGVPVEFTLLLAPRSLARALAPSFPNVARRSFPLDFHSRTALLAAQGDMLAAVGDPAAARQRYHQARDALEAAIDRRTGPVKWIAQGSEEGRLTNVTAALGDRRAARAAAIRTERALPIAADHVEGVRRRLDLVEAMVRLGDYHAAIRGLEVLLNRPAPISRQLLAIDPLWRPLLNHPDFGLRLRGPASPITDSHPERLAATVP